MAIDVRTTGVLTCDRCHVVVEYTDPKMPLRPDGWKILDRFDLCPECSNRFADFMGWPLDNDSEGQA